MAATKRIIAFSVYGDAPMYLRGAVENARLAPIRYPGWTARFYVSQEIPRTLIDELKAHGAETVPMLRRAPHDGMFWRFLAADDPDAAVVIFRDTDSRLSEREVAAVDEWLASERSLHLMRDHPNHGAAVMGGMWGLRRGSLEPMSKLLRRWTIRQRIVGNQHRTRGADQRFLAAMVYPRTRGNAMIHSEFRYFAGEDVRPFPVPAVDGEFVGQIVRADNTPDPVGAAVRAAHPGPIDGGVVEAERLLTGIARAPRHLLGRAAGRARRTLRR